MRQHDTPGGAPKITMMESEDINEHQQRIASAEQTLVAELRGTGAVPAPPAAPVPPANAAQA